MSQSSEELYRKHRPKKLKDVLGQEAATRMLWEMWKSKRIPHALLLVGPSGTGKTTLARILRKKLGCGDSDFYELNVADFRGIDMIRDIRSRMNLAPMAGNCRVYLLDEVSELTKNAMDSFLKILEDTPSHVYFMLCTTDPQKLKKTIITRCTEVKLRSLDNKSMEKLLNDTAEKEEFKLTEEVRDKIIDHAEGGARKALVLLNQIVGLEAEEDQLDAISKADFKSQAIQLARLLMKPNAKWPEVAGLLKDLDDDAEGVRRMLLAYFQSVLLGGGKMAGKAYVVIDALRDPLYDIGKPGLTAACWEIVRGED